jgi:lipopolysaccharide transport system ATP-binding protein
MSSVARSGRTIMFVSHNMRAIQGLCDSAILLRDGSVAMIGTPQQCAEAYLKFDDIAAGGFVDLAANPRIRRRGSGRCKFTSFELLRKDGERSGGFAFGEPFDVRVGVSCESAVEDLTLGFSFITSDGIEFMGTAAHDGGVKCDLKAGMNMLECSISPMVLTPGTYIIRAAVFRHGGEVFDHIDEILEFEVHNVVAPDANVPQDHLVGMVHVPYRWRYLSPEHELELGAVN